MRRGGEGGVVSEGGRARMLHRPALCRLGRERWDE